MGGASSRQDSEQDAALPAAEWREVRVALVLYGGVSLAIYMYGVVHTIWQAVRASRELEAGKADPDNPWTEVLTGLQRRVTVDVISGASAGGINGILLGRALTTGGDLSIARKVWLDTGDFKTLLRDDARPRSLLRSDFFKQQLTKGLDEMDSSAAAGTSLVDVLDVSVSTTHLEGAPRTFTDSLEHQLATKRHKVPVRLRYRNPRRFAAVLGLAGETVREEAGAGSGQSANDNDFTNTRLLVQLARATSAFPAAFEPVRRNEGEHGFGGWPAGNYADGGVTDNKPFEGALQTIFGRAADRPVSRWVLSVDPDPALPASGRHFDPDFLDVVAAAIFTIPRYESIEKDLDELYDHRTRVRQFWATAFDDVEPLEAADGTVNAVSDQQYDWLRRAALVSFLAQEYRRARQDRGGQTQRTTWAEDQARISQLLPDAPNDWRALDTAFEVRRAYYVIKLLGRQAESEGLSAEIVEARRKMWRLFEAARNASWEALQPLLARDDAGLDTSALSTGVGPTGPPPAVEELQTAGEAFAGYEARDRSLLAVDPHGLALPKDQVDHAQIDPSAAPALNDLVPAEDRLAGDTLGHFGGFLDRGWRENDVRWGRLDAADVLVRTLGSHAPATDTERLTSHVQAEIVRSELGLSADSDWRLALAQSHSAGRDDLGDVPGQRLSVLAARAGGVGQRMFGSLSPGGRTAGPALLRRVLKPLGSGALKALTPVLFLLALVMGKGKPSVRALAAASLVLALGVTVYLSVVKPLLESGTDVLVFVCGWALSVVLGLVAKWSGS